MEIIILGVLSIYAITMSLDLDIKIWEYINE